MLRRLIAAALLAALPVQAQAQQVCMTYRKQADGNTYRQVDREATFLFQQMLARPDPRVRQAMSGVWQAQIPAPQLNMMLYASAIYEPNGLWQYSNRTCGGMINTCSNSAGHGVYVGTVQGNRMTIMIMYSDLEVENACISRVVQMVGPGMLRDATGATWRKVR
jgi:hypothetical protein